MPVFETTNFGPISFLPESVFEFPRGMPGFEEHRHFVPVQNPQTAPMLFLQSLDDPSLCFITLPVLALDPRYRLQIVEEDLEVLEWLPKSQPCIGDGVLCLAVLSVRETGATANLLAPVVVNLTNRKAVQAVAPGSKYSHQHALFTSEAAICS
jgi:flagellar assembly factor FliW